MYIIKATSFSLYKEKNVGEIFKGIAARVMNWKPPALAAQHHEAEKLREFVDRVQKVQTIIAIITVFHLTRNISLMCINKLRLYSDAGKQLNVEYIHA